MARTLKKQANNFSQIKHEYMKESDINDFSNYQAMITDKFLLKKAENQTQINLNLCKRNICNAIHA